MLALKFDGKLRLANDEPARQREGEALVRVLMAGICNTDIEITKGYAAFRGIPGHEFVGRVEAAPDQTLIGRRVVGEINAGCGNCALCQAGDARHCSDRSVLGIVNRDGAFAQYLSLPCSNLLVVPDSISDQQAVFTEPLAAAGQILSQASIRAADRVAVIGDGKLGLLIAQVLNLTACRLILIGKHAEKLAIAKQLGIETATVDQLIDERFDYVVEASGSATGMAMALDITRPRGVIILKSTYADQLRLDAARIVVNEITILGSRCGRFDKALELLAANKIDVASLISRTFPLSEGLAAFDCAQQPGILKVLLQP